ncbi:hypothetical protein [Robertmurraya siralis]|uniref:hypothetical protein n=1 Tax=Robertmurraya siralis TaxID=77777 RepID=UPI0010F98CC5|nr:hypothetical protein [Robertmurraya siralis]
MSIFLTTLNRDLDSEIINVLEHLDKCLENWKVKEFKTLTDTLGNLHKIKMNSNESADVKFYKSIQEKIETIVYDLQKKYKEDLDGGNYDNYRHWLISLDRLVSLHKDIEYIFNREFKKRIEVTCKLKS